MTLKNSAASLLVEGVQLKELHLMTSSLFQENTHTHTLVRLSATV